jgi:parvulin-like peptidyl-prolyl isomerase
MKTLPFFRSAGAALALALVSPAVADQTNGIAVVVNGRPILRSEVEEVIKVQEMGLKQSIGDKSELDREMGELRKKALDTLIDQ